MLPLFILVILLSLRFFVIIFPADRIAARFHLQLAFILIKDTRKHSKYNSIRIVGPLFAFSLYT